VSSGITTSFKVIESTKIISQNLKASGITHGLETFKNNYGLKTNQQRVKKKSSSKEVT